MSKYIIIYCSYEVILICGYGLELHCLLQEARSLASSFLYDSYCVLNMYLNTRLFKHLMINYLLIYGGCHIYFS